MAIEHGVTNTTESHASPPADRSLQNPLLHGREQASKRKQSHLVLSISQTDDSVQGVFLEMSAAGTMTGRRLGPEQLQSGLSRSHKSVTLLVYKSEYLTRTVTLPASDPDELREMLTMEAEASLPADYGSIEVAYRQLSSDAASAGKTNRYELYIISTQTVCKYLEKLQPLGITPRMILPSAVFWALALKTLDADHVQSQHKSGLLLAQRSNEQYETAHLDTHGAVHVRTINGTTREQRSGQFTDSLRAAARSKSMAGGPLQVGYLDAQPPDFESFDSTLMIDQHAQWGKLPGLDSGPGHDNSILSLAARALVSLPGIADWSTANLLPRSVTEASTMRKNYRLLAVGFISVVLSLGMLLLAIKVSTWRYENELTQLNTEISSIREQGEAIGVQLAQLKAVAEARATSHIFGDVIGDLHKAQLGDGLSYSEVNFQPGGLLVLRGQARSLALPFELPQRLESLDSMANVILRNAAQTQKGEGSIAEFRIEANYEWGNAR